jgi:hypothetical protein
MSLVDEVVDKMLFFADRKDENRIITVPNNLYSFSFFTKLFVTCTILNLNNSY